MKNASIELKIGKDLIVYAAIIALKSKFRNIYCLQSYFSSNPKHITKSQKVFPKVQVLIKTQIIIRVLYIGLKQPLGKTKHENNTKKPQNPL